jgi:hypothetical protein
LLEDINNARAGKMPDLESHIEVNKSYLQKNLDAIDTYAKIL